jgi:hypothetical protein
VKLRIFLIAILTVTIGWADTRPRLSISAGWAGFYRLDNYAKQFYKPFALAPHGRFEIRLIDGLQVYAAIQYSQEVGNTMPITEPIKFKNLWTEYGVGYRFEGDNTSIIPYIGYSIMYLKEMAFNENFNRRAYGINIGIKLNYYIGDESYILLNTNYSNVKIGIDDIRSQLGGLRFQIGIGTHIRFFESYYSED